MIYLGNNIYKADEGFAFYKDEILLGDVIQIGFIEGSIDEYTEQKCPEEELLKLYNYGEI